LPTRFGGSVVPIPREAGGANPQGVPLTTLDMMRRERAMEGTSLIDRQRRAGIAQEQGVVDEEARKAEELEKIRLAKVEPARLAGEAKLGAAAATGESRERAAEIRKESDLARETIRQATAKYGADLDFQAAKDELAQAEAEFVRSGGDPNSEAGRTLHERNLQGIREKAREEGNAKLAAIAGEMLKAYYIGKAGLYGQDRMDAPPVKPLEAGAVEAVKGAASAGRDLNADGVINAADDEILEITNAIVAGNWRGNKVTEDVATELRKRLAELKTVKGALPKPKQG